MQEPEAATGVPTNETDSKSDDETKELLRGILAELKTLKPNQNTRDAGEGVADGSTAVEVETELQRKVDSEEIPALPEINPFMDSIRDRQPRPDRAKECLWAQANENLPKKVKFHSPSAIAQMYAKDSLVQVMWDNPPLKLESNGERVPVRFEVTDAHRKAWTRLVGDIWQVPADGRLPFLFQQSQLTLNRRPFTYREASLLPKALEMLSGGKPDVIICDYVNGLAHFYKTNMQKRFVQLGTAQDLETKEATDEDSQECYSAPWQRIVSIRGLESSTLGRDEANIFPARGILNENIIDWYLNCLAQRNLEFRGLASLNLGLPKQKTFYLVFYEISEPQDNSPQKRWKSGRLHSDERKYWLFGGSRPGAPEGHYRVLKECAYAIITCTGDGGEPRYYWTLLELTSHKTCKPYEDILEPDFKNPSARCDVLLYLLYYVYTKAPDVLTSWKGLLMYFNHILDVSDAYFHPDQHDKLLTDDDTFSRSKKYFWAITTLKEIDKRISDNIREISELIDSRAPSQAELEHRTQFEFCRARLADELGGFKRTAENFRAKRLEAIDLRDGLFSASAVIDSRASIRQSENIKLLTFVSIFFLPLSFCMAIWSINKETFSLNALKVTAVLVSLSTYVAVINLNNLAQLFRGLYQSFADHLVGIMAQDPNLEWKQRGLLFRKFAKEQEMESKPSNWRLLQYGFRTYILTSAIRSRVDDWTSRFRQTKKQELPPPNGSATQDTKKRTAIISGVRRKIQDAIPVYTKAFVPAQLRRRKTPTTRNSTNENDDMGRGEVLPPVTDIAQRTLLQQDIELDDIPAEPADATLGTEGSPSLRVVGDEGLANTLNQTTPHGELEPRTSTAPRSSLVSAEQDREHVRVPNRGEVRGEREENGERSAVV